MKKFNKQIEIIVEVDTIAEQLLHTFSHEHGTTHREQLTEAIINNLLETSVGITHLYNSLNGISNEFKFKKGDTIECETNVTNHKFDTEEDKWISLFNRMGVASVVSVNPCALKFDMVVSYKYTDPKGNIKFKEVPVSSFKCTLVHRQKGKIDLSKKGLNRL